MLTTNCAQLIGSINCLTFIIILLLNCHHFVSSTSSDPHNSGADSRSDLVSRCNPHDTLSPNKIIQLHDDEGESSIYLKSSGNDKQLTECVIVIQSSPGFGLIVHPVSLQLTTDHVVITIYQLHLATKTSKQLFRWSDRVSFDLNDQHKVDPVACDYVPKDNVTSILITIESSSDDVTWRSIDFRLLITSFLPIKDPLASCPGSFYFDCGLGQCIRQSLHCDGFSNCQNGIDEHGCSLSTHEIFFIVISIIIMLTIVIGLIWYARRQEAKEDEKLNADKSLPLSVTAL